MNTPLVSSAVLALALLAGSARLLAIDSAAVKAQFASPPREYATAPLWVWNDRLTEDQIRDTLRDLAGQQVRQAFVHPRPGLMTPYLSDEWFRLWKAALDEAERLDMNIWIYDENSYPSGFAGGFVPELMPESRGRGLELRESKTAPKWAGPTVAVFRLEGGRAENVSGRVRAGETLPEGTYLTATVVRSGNSPWHGDRSYVDLLKPGVTEKFLEVTLEAYKREVGGQFGKRILGAFTDEPNIRPAGGLSWTDDLPEQFRKRWGYDLVEHLPSLVREVGDWRRIRHNYYRTCNELFIERWAKPYYEWCERNGIAFTGHYWDHEWPNCGGVPDNMAMAAWQQLPGIDCLMNQYAEHTHAQFGNVRMCRELLSVANQLGRARTLCEIYGAGGWDLRFEDMKRIADWLAVLGVNLFDEHLSYVTLRGARKRDHPQSFSYHEPWWEAYHVMARYITRLSYALSQGKQINRVLVLEPTTTAWMYQDHGAKLNELGSTFFRLLMTLEAAQVEYDLADEDILRRHGSVTGNELKVGQRSYRVLVLPPATENLDSSTVKLLEEWQAAGGPVLACGGPVTRVDGAASDRANRLASNPGWTVVQPEATPALLRRWSGAGEFNITRPSGDAGILFHHRRQLDDGDLVFLVNTSIEHPSVCTLESNRKGIERWNLDSGAIAGHPFETTGDGVKTTVTLEPSGSLLLFLSNAARKPATTPPAATTLTASGTLEVRRLEPNVLPLDYVDITAGGETRTNQYFYAANQFAWQKNGTSRNPWDSAVQFKDELIRRTFPAGSGFEATYRFTIEGAPPPNLTLVVERPDLYTIACNGTPLTPAPGEWWLDKTFGRLPLAAAARAGDNAITLKAAPFTIYHELEPAYVLGDFALKATQRGWTIAPDQPLQLADTEPRLLHDINPDGTMWLSGGVGFASSATGQPVEDRAPFLIFDLGRPVDLTSLEIWNYNEGHARDFTARGADAVRVSASADGAVYNRALGEFRLRRAAGRARPQALPVATSGVRFVRIDFLSNHHGVTYPATGAPADNGFVGLAEVRFLTTGGARLGGVSVAQASSELASHHRVARHVVDGSGLSGTSGLGWNEQGHPFYAHGVAYRQVFKVDKKNARYTVALSKWYGSVARVRVNGDLAGYIAAPPWDLDVTDELVSGDNRVEVSVFGTLKNTLGPHHGNPGLGSAWPGMFQHGPMPGPPPGDLYHTVGYGLFEPFVLKVVDRAE